MSNLWEAFEATAVRCGESPAFLCGDSRYSFRDWHLRSRELAAAYLECGLRPGDRALLWMQNEFDMAAALAAVWACDGIAAIMDASCRAPQLEYALGKVRPRLLLHSSTLPSIPEGVEVAVIDVNAAGDTPLASIKSRSLATDAASIVFTSGSTGQPKGVVQSHRNLIAGCKAVTGYLGVRSDDRLVCPVPWSFDYGYGQLLATMLHGIPHVIPTLPNPSGICESLQNHRPTLLAGTPSLFNFLVGGMSPIEDTDLSSVRLLTSTGGTMHAPVLERLRRLFSHSDIVLNYGLTETYRSCYLPAHMLETHAGAIGLPIPGVDIVVLREDGSIAAPGEHGEIVHRGDYIFMGYWDDKESTARALRDDPLAAPGTPASARAMFTGDIGYLSDDGVLYFVARRDHQLKSMGVRVSPGEVEALLLQSGLLTEVAVYGVPHEVMGHEIRAAIVPRDAGSFRLADLQKHARELMSQYMMPRAYRKLASLPRTTSGKVDYESLRRES